MTYEFIGTAEKSIKVGGGDHGKAILQLQKLFPCSLPPWQKPGTAPYISSSLEGICLYWWLVS